MSDPQTRSNVWRGAAASVDAGLRAYMLSVYNLMALAIGFTGVVCYYVASNEVLMRAIFGTPLKWVVFAGVLGLGWMAPGLILKKSLATAHIVFWSYAALLALLITPMIYVSTQADVARAFFITSAIFASLSFYGYTTKRDLAPWGKFLFMASLGLFLAIIVNVFFIKSSPLDLFLSIGMVLIVSAMTAYQTQTVKDSYDPSDSPKVARAKAILGALGLYATFVTIFFYVLRILSFFRN